MFSNNYRYRSHYLKGLGNINIPVKNTFLYFLLAFTLLIAAFLLVACDTAAPVVQVTGTPESVATYTFEPSRFVTTPSPSRTANLFPTVTDLPPASEPTPTFPPTAAVRVATLDAIIAEKPELKDHYSSDRYCMAIDNCTHNQDLGLSSNEEWAVFFNSERGTGGLCIAGVENKKQWCIYYADFEDITGCDCYMDIVHWSQDGRYLYIMPRMAADGGSAWFWEGSSHLIRMDLENGTWVDTGMGTAHSFSPGDRYIAFRRGNELVVHEFLTGEERIFVVPEEYTEFGQLVWSPDTSQIMFVASTVEELLDYERDPAGLSLFLLDVTSMQAHMILEKDERFLFPLEWQDGDAVFFGSLLELGPSGYAECCHTLYQLDLTTDEISVYRSP